MLVHDAAWKAVRLLAILVRFQCLLQKNLAPWWNGIHSVLKQRRPMDCGFESHRSYQIGGIMSKTQIELEFPYNQVWRKGYIVTNKENRKTVILFNNKSDRSSTQYARYLLSVKLKRFLTDEETVDHIDDDKTNDHIDNLQILSREENVRKHFKQPDIQLICPVCKTTFNRSLTQIRGKKERAKENMIACSRQCGGRMRHLR